MSPIINQFITATICCWKVNPRSPRETNKLDNKISNDEKETLETKHNHSLNDRDVIASLFLRGCYCFVVLFVARIALLGADYPKGPENFPRGAAGGKRQGERGEDGTIRRHERDHTTTEDCFNRLGSGASPCGLPSVSYYGPTLDANWLRAPGNHRNVLPESPHGYRLSGPNHH